MNWARVVAVVPLLKYLAEYSTQRLFVEVVHFMFECGLVCIFQDRGSDCVFNYIASHGSIFFLAAEPRKMSWSDPTRKMNARLSDSEVRGLNPQ